MHYLTDRGLSSQVAFHIHNRFEHYYINLFQRFTETCKSVCSLIFKCFSALLNTSTAAITSYWLMTDIKISVRTDLMARLSAL